MASLCSAAMVRPLTRSYVLKGGLKHLSLRLSIVEEV